MLLLLIINLTRAAEVTHTIPVGTGYGEMAYDSGKGEIFASNYNGTVSVISDSSNEVVANVNVGGTPDSITYDSGKGEVFVVNDASGIVSVISDTNNTVIANITVRKQGNVIGPIRLAYDSAKGEIFASHCDQGLYINGNTGIVSVISDSNNTVVANISVDGIPEDIAYSNSRGEIFVVGINPASQQSNCVVSIIADFSNTVIDSLHLDAGSATAIAYDSGMNEMFMAPSTKGVVVMSVRSNTEVSNLFADAHYNIGSLAYDSGKGAILAVVSGGSVLIISDKTNNLVGNLTNESTGHIVYDSSKGEIFATNFSSKVVTVLSDATVTQSPAVPEFNFQDFVIVLALAGGSIATVVYFKPKRNPSL
jgi:YVTN family beta-propeller protein